LHGRAGGPVRLLHPRNDDARPRAAAENALPDRRTDPWRAAAEPVPLRNAHAHPARGQARRAGDEVRRRDQHPEGACPMNAMPGSTNLSRRALIAGTGALIVSFSISRALAEEAQNKGEEP